MTNFSEELIEKAKTAKSIEELTAIAKESGIELTEDQAQVYFTRLNSPSGELADEELDNVAGGGSCGSFPGLNKCYDGWRCLSCGSYTWYEGEAKYEADRCSCCRRLVSCMNCTNYIAVTDSCLINKK